MTQASAQLNAAGAGGAANGAERFIELKSEPSLEYIRPKELTELIGTYLGVVEGKFGPNYKFEREEDGKIVVVNGCGALNNAMTKVTIGTLVKLTNRGETKITNGKNKGKRFHDIAVAVKSQARA